MTSSLVSAKRLPETTAHVRVTRQSWQQGFLEGEVSAGNFHWHFQWHFRRGELSVKPLRFGLNFKLQYYPVSVKLSHKAC